MYEQLFELNANLLKALAHPRRLEIVQLLRDQELCVSDVYEMLDLPQANISQHLIILRQAGVVKTKKDGKHILYSLASKKISKATDFLREFLIDQNQDTEVAKQLSLDIKKLLPLVHDPVCKMRLSPKTASYSAKFGTDTYYFCASSCYKKFIEGPKTYAQSY